MTLTQDDANRIIECAIAKGRTPFNRGRRSQSCSIYGETSRWSWTGGSPSTRGGTT
jgi:hypothetical protein